MASLQTTRRWHVAPSSSELASKLAQQLNIAPLTARIMVARGIQDEKTGRRFLAPSLERDWADPLLIPGMDEVATRLERAFANRETIAVFGDFDVDGITSTTLLTEALRTLGADAHPFIPRRFGEGYGMSAQALERVITMYDPHLIVTVDNGIAAKNEFAYLRERGCDLVVTDHHEPSDLVPVGIPLTDPKLAADGPSHELAGAGVALKLVHELGRRLGAPDLWRRFTELAALGTIADMMLLTPENRALVADGIACMRCTDRPGYKALAGVSHTDLSHVAADSLSFSLIPRINAAGRMADPACALDLLMAKDEKTAAALAQQLEEINQERRRIEGELAAEALARAQESYQGARVIVLGGEGWHEGVKGIVASKLTQRYHVPVILFSIEGKIARGSGRSVGSVNLFAAVEQAADVLERFGGHPGAVGVTCATKNIAAFRERLEAILSQIPAEDFEDRAEIATTADLSELDVDTVRQLSLLEPFGQGNKIPLLAVTGITMENRSSVGRAGEHVRFTATDGRSKVPAIMFRAPECERLLVCDSVVDLVFEAVAETWQGRTKTKLMVKDVLVHEAPSDASCKSCLEQDDISEALVQLEADTDISSHSSSCAGVPIALPLQEDAHECVEPDPSRRSQLSRLTYDELTRSLIHTMIGNSEPHAAQIEALSLLAAHQNVLAVMGTGRGKSLIFHVHAAREAIVNGRASVFVYPLRALVADQAFHLAQSFAHVGLRVGTLTGESLQAVRDRSFAELARGTLDIVLTTPEFLSIHCQRFAAARRIGFLVLDEAHHMEGAKGGDRSAYLEMPRILDALGQPEVLACTATAPAAALKAIRALLPIDAVVTDDATRKNLQLDDERNLYSRENRLISIVAAGEKCVIYVNSREQSISLTRSLRRRVPEYGGAIAYYNAGLTQLDRTRIEEAFRSGELVCVVSTSAFGEGVNLPDIRHVVLYHMPFSATEFNQMSGRAGRDGLPAHIHLLYSRRDARINERLLDAAAPTREVLVVLYRALQTMWRSHRTRTGDVHFVACDVDIAQMCLTIDTRCNIDARSVAAGLAIFEELGFVRLGFSAGERTIEMVERPEHIDLTSSIRYLEALHARRAFASFCDWALKAQASDMLARINRPIISRGI